MAIIDLTDEQNAKRWKVQEPQTLTDEQIERFYSRHTEAEDSREGCAGDDDPREGSGAVLVPAMCALGLVLAAGLAALIARFA